MHSILQRILRDRSAASHAALLGIAIIVVYGTSVLTPLFGDDTILLTRARDTGWSPSELARAFRLEINDLTDGWKPPALENYRLFFFRPLVVATFKIDQTLWDARHPGYHITNLIIQFLVVWCVYSVARDASLRSGFAFLCAMLFIAYTPNMMTVNWVSGRTETLSGLFVLIAVRCSGRYWKSNSVSALTLAYAAFLAGLATKENAVLIPAFAMLACFTLYPCPWNPRKFTAALSPCIVIYPVYFWLRAKALDGFPTPPEGYYYHHFWNAEFPLFFVVKVAHSIVSLMWQFPAPLLPELIQRSAPAMAVFIALAIATLVVAYRWTPAKLRCLTFGWIALALLPTAPIGFNPIYFYLPSVAVALLYTYWIERWLDSSDQPRPRLATTVASILLFVGGPVCIASSGYIRDANAPTRNTAEGAVAAFRAYSNVKRIYVLDLPARQHFAAAEMRMRDARLKDVEIVVLNLSPLYLRPAPSAIYPVDDRTFFLTPTEANYFTTGFENVVLRKAVLDLHEGQRIEGPGYTIEVTKTGPVFETRIDSPSVAFLRGHLSLPAAQQLGVLELRVEFDRPLAADDTLFVQVVDGGVEVIDFGAFDSERGNN